MKTPCHFSFDPAKNARNIELREICFTQVERFDFETAVVAVDDRKEYGEIREVAAGFIDSRLHILVFTRRGETCHVISLRKANKREYRSYVNKIEETG